uniref:Uncharacterized protein LOC111107184 isoform X2 n=1 Tax=Crassostrea virginica TaxID=6565 RepID=A0A8B8B4C7_CRAVI|nr:uncharacterized protein LOC111107184 isoform X2 [Crassostrea virginica]
MEVVPPINLPYGKEYHLFLSFCNDDKEKALLFLESLEETYKLKCLYHLRDFQAGKTIFENILNGIETSMKIVYLVSKEFKNSYSCKTEILYGITASHQQSENCMIPVLLEKTEMPRELLTLNYVDATLDEVDVPKKIYEACLFGVSSNCILPNVIPFQEFYNGTPLRVLRRTETWKRCIPVTRFKEDLQERRNISDEDRSRRIDELCETILKDMNSSKFARRYFMYSNAFFCRAWVFFVLGLPSFAVLPVLLFLVIERDITEAALDGLTSALTVVPMITVSVLFSVLCHRNSKQDGADLKSITWKHLKNNYKTLKVLPLLCSTEEVVLLNYDTEGCKRIAEEMILNFIERKQTLLAQWTVLPDFKYNRHNTYTQKKCICQCLEPYITTSNYL